MFGKKVKPLHIPGPGDFSVEVVGESHYQQALARICGGKQRKEDRKEVTAVLIHEDNNKFDNQAVRVEISGQTVGYLSREEALNLRQELIKAGRPGLPISCDAVILGGTAEKPNFGVLLDLPTDDEDNDDDDE